MVWTDNEIGKYVPINESKLNSLYNSRRLDKSNPEERSKFLAEDFLKLDKTDYNIIRKIAREQGNPNALRRLEEMAVSELND